MKSMYITQKVSAYGGGAAGIIGGAASVAGGIGLIVAGPIGWVALATWMGLGASVTSVAIKGGAYFAKKSQLTLQS